MNSRITFSSAVLGALFFTLTPIQNAYSDLPEVDRFLRERPRLSDDQRKFLKKYAGKYLKDSFKRIAESNRNKMNGDTFRDLKTNESKKRILEEFAVRSKQPHSTNWPGFTNSSSYLWEVINLSEGACYGMTELIRKMNLLAIFDPENRSGATVPPRTNPKEYFEFYDRLFGKIADNEVAVFPGFSDFKSLYSDSLVRRAMKERVVILWAEKNARFSVLFQMYKSPKFKLRNKELAVLHRKLKSRLELNYNPVIFIAKPIKDWIHVLQVISVSDRAADGSWSASVWDPNSPPPGSQRTLTVDRNGNTYYDGTLTEVEIAPGDDQEIGKIAGSITRFCSENASLCDLQTHP